MPWFNVDDSFHSHPKVLATEPAALGLWVVAGSWSSANLTEGFVPDHVLPRLLPDSAKLARALVTAGLWKRAQGGYLFHDWTDFNATREAVLRKRAQAAERQRRHREKPPPDSHAFVTRDTTRDSRVSHSAQSNPIQSVVDVVSHVADRYARLDDDDQILRTIIDCLRERTGQAVSADHARLVATQVLRGRRPSDPVSYLRKAITSEPHPDARFLPPPGAVARPAWCGKCDERTRLRDHDDGTVARCPDCHPTAGSAAS